MLDRVRRFSLEYVVAILSVALALGLRWLLNPLLDNRLPFITLYAAVAVAVWYGGRGPAVLATFLGYAGAAALFLQHGPGALLSVRGPGGLAGLALFLVSAFIVIGFGSGMRSALRRSETASRVALRERRRLEDALAERERAEEALRATEQRFVHFMHHLPGLAWIKDLEGRYVFANEAAQRAFRVPQERLYGRTDDEIFAPHTADQFQENDRRALQSEFGLSTVETLEHEDRTLHHSIVSKFPIMDADGEPAFVGGMAIDITDRIRAEEALQAANDRKDEFLAMMAHELRNPLAPIRNALQVMRLAPTSLATTQEAREIIDRQVAHVVRIVDDLLDLSRVTSGKIELRKQRVGLATVVEASLETCRSMIEEAGHELTVSLPKKPLYLEADLTRLAQVLSNLLNNACKYTPSGGRIWLTAAQHRAEAVITVRDTGVGISKEMLPEVFEMFTQVDRSLTRSQGGLGIGLTLVRRLVEMHGGTVQAMSEGPGHGSTFIVRLPTATGALDAHHLPEADDTIYASSAARRILIADDNSDSADSLKMMLTILGNDVRTAYDGGAALETAASFCPEVVFLDIGMPKLNGFDVARRIREQPFGRHAVLIAITGWGQPEDRQRSEEAGFDFHFVKPVDPDQVRKLLHSLEQTPART